MFLKTFSVLILLCLAGVSVNAQNIKGTIAGNVTDPQDAVVSGATVTVTNSQRGFTQTLKTNESGAFRFVSLDPSDAYEIKVEAAGFEPKIIKNIAVRVGETANIDARLGVSVSEIVTIDDTFNFRSLQTDDAKLSRTFSSEEMNDLPVQAGGQGRNFYAQARTAPGVAVTTQAHAPFSISGNRPRSNNYLLDSVDNTDANTGLIAGRGVTEQIVSQEAVQSFEVLTHNFKAEFGRNSGGVVNLVTKSGTNQIRGSAYWYHNNSALSANGVLPTLQGQPKSPNLSNLAGFTIGAPVIKNKLWIFGQYEIFRVRGTSPTLYQGLTAAEKANANSSVAALATLYPTVSNSQNRLITLGVPSATDQTTYLLRSDWAITDAQRLMFRAADTKSERESLGVGGLLTSSAPGTRRTAGATLQHSWTLSPYIVNEFRLGYNRQVEKDSETPDPLFLGNRVVNGDIGQLRVTGLTPLGIPNFLNQFLFQNNTQITNDTTILRGNHAFKFGGSLRFVKVNGGNIDSSFRGQLVFNSITQFLNAAPASYQINVGNPRIGLRRKEIALYAQDDWRIRRNLTLNLGLRYEIFTAPREVDDKLAPEYLLSTQYNNFAPRFGFSWELIPKTVVRGGYGIYYNILETTFLGLTKFNPPFIQTFSASSPTFPNLLGNNPRRISDFVLPSQDAKTPYSQHFNLAVERELFNPQSSVSVAYVGTLGRNLSRTRRPNGGEQFPSGQTRPDPTRGVVNLLETTANSSYHSLQIGLTQRFTPDFQIRAAYTYSKFIDEVSDIINSNTGIDRRLIPFDERDLSLDRAVSDYDIPHLFTLTFSYRLPFFRKNDLAGKILGGWTVSGITTLRSGQPFTIYTGTITPSGNNNQRPNNVAGSLITDASAPQAIRFADGFNAVSIRPANGTYGNLGRNTGRTDNFYESNVSLQKDFRFSEKFRAQIRGEFFNIFNTNNFNAVDSVISSATFGRYTSAFEPRRAQVALRFVF